MAFDEAEKRDAAKGPNSLLAREKTLSTEEEEIVRMCEVVKGVALVNAGALCDVTKSHPMVVDT